MSVLDDSQRCLLVPLTPDQPHRPNITTAELLRFVFLTPELAPSSHDAQYQPRITYPYDNTVDINCIHITFLITVATVFGPGRFIFCPLHNTIFDGHKGQLSSPMNALCAEQKINLVVLPLHSSHLLQPSDQLIFRRMKQESGQLGVIRTLTNVSSTLERVWGLTKHQTLRGLSGAHGSTWG